jgi:hypothetical protein
MVLGSITRIRSQSMRGPRRSGCRRATLKARLASVPPTMVMLLSATEPLVEKPGGGGGGSQEGQWEWGRGQRVEGSSWLAPVAWFVKQAGVTKTSAGHSRHTCANAK